MMVDDSDDEGAISVRLLLTCHVYIYISGNTQTLTLWSRKSRGGAVF